MQHCKSTILQLKKKRISRVSGSRRNRNNLAEKAEALGAINGKRNYTTQQESEAQIIFKQQCGQN